MSDSTWRGADGHPPLGTLVLMLEHELDRRSAAEIDAHVENCWTCRAQIERLQTGIYKFVEYRQGALKAAAPPSGSRHRFLRRLHDFADQRQGTLFGWTRPFRKLQTPWLGAAAFMFVVAVILLLSLAHPPVLSANEFIERASAAAIRPARPGWITRQKVRIRQGRRSMERLVELGVPAQAAAGGADPAIIEAFRTAQMDWNDPLNPQPIAKWRAEQRNKKDEVLEASDSITLLTRSLERGVVRSASLTVRRADWRPIAEIIQFTDYPDLEVTELKYEQTPVLKAGPAVSRMVTAKVESSQPLTAPVDSEAQLDEAELVVREALHAIHADVESAPEIRRWDGQVLLSAYVDSSGRKQEILRAIGAVPRLRVEIHDLSEDGGAPAGVPGTGSTIETRSSDEGFQTNPPLAKPLADYVGGPAIAQNYTAALSAASISLIRESLALSKLQERYPDGAFGQMPAARRERVDRIALDLVAAMERDWDAYVPLLNQSLDHFMNHDVSGADNAPCESWRGQAPEVVGGLRDLKRATDILFTIQVLKEPEEISAETQLSKAVQARSRIARAFMAICRP